MTEQDRARQLARWLDEPPGTRPPEGVEADAVEAVYALRPDLAPPPSITADDILAEVSTGPLAASAAADVAPNDAPAVVPFPPRLAQATPANDPAWWRRANRWGGLGVIVATAATLVLVALPVMQSDEVNQAPAASARQEGELLDRAPATAAPAPAEPAAAAPARQRSGGGEDANREADAPMAQKKAAPASPPTEERTYPMVARSGSAQEADIIPEASAPARAAEQQQGGTIAPDVDPYVGAEGLDAVADLGDEKRGLEEAEAEDDDLGYRTPSDNAVPGPATGKSAPLDLVDLRSQAMPAGIDSWRATVDGVTRSRIDNANAIAENEASRGNHRAAAEAIRQTIAPPAQAGQAQAARTASYYLSAGENGAALNAAQQGLVLSQENTPERAWLLVVTGDVRRALGDDEGAMSLYEEAARLNRSR